MKARSVHIVVESHDATKKRFVDAWQKIERGAQPHPSNVLGFQDIATFRKALTEERLKLLRAIRRHEPDSVYALAKLLNRDLKSINTDVSTLKQLGLITLRKTSHNGRKRTKPIVTFDRLQMSIAIA